MDNVGYMVKTIASFLLKKLHHKHTKEETNPSTLPHRENREGLKKNVEAKETQLGSTFPHTYTLQNHKMFIARLE